MAPLNALLAALVCATPLFALAGPHADALGECLADSTTGKERKEMARWMFVAMTVHPEMRTLSAAKESDREQSSRNMGALITKLMSEDCPQQIRMAMQNEGKQAIDLAFETLGGLAMQELMSNQDVSRAMVGFERYIDQKKVEAAIRAK